MAVIALASMSLVCTVLVLNFHHHSPTTRPPKWLRIVTNDYIAWMLRMQFNAREQQDTGFRTPTKCFPKTETSETRKVRSEKVAIHDEDSEAYDLSTVSPELYDNETLAEPGSSNYMHQAMFKLVGLTTSLVEKMKDDNTSDEMQAEWTAIAHVLDRFFLVIFCLVTLFVTIGLLGFSPMSGPSMVEPYRVT